jgi:hypothetical protein
MSSFHQKTSTHVHQSLFGNYFTTSRSSMDGMGGSATTIVVSGLAHGIAGLPRKKAPDTPSDLPKHYFRSCAAPTRAFVGNNAINRGAEMPLHALVFHCARSLDLPWVRSRVRPSLATPRRGRYAAAPALRQLQQGSAPAASAMPCCSETSPSKPTCIIALG